MRPTASLRPTLLFVILLMTGLAAVPPDAEAQIWRRVKERAKERVQQRVEDRVDQAVDDAVDRAWDGAEDRVAGAVGAAAQGAAARATSVQPPADLDLGPIATSPTGAAAIRYRETTVSDMPMLGALGRMAEQPEATITTVTFTATHSRHDDGETTTIIDATTGAMTMLDHAARTVMHTSAQAMMDRARAVQQDADAQLEEAQREARSTTPEGVRYAVAVRAEATGRTESILGAPARQTLIVIETEVDASEAARADGQSAEDAASARGRFFTLIETWTAEQVAGTDTRRAFAERMAQTYGEAAQQAMPSRDATDVSALAAFGVTPEDAAAAGAAVQDALADVEGLPVRTTVHTVLVPDGQPFDPEAVLSGDTGGAGGLAALAGSSQDAAGQVVLFRVTTHVSDLAPVTLDAQPFAAPADYRVVTFGR